MSTGLERKLAMKPRPRLPAAMQARPTAMAKAAATTMRSSIPTMPRLSRALATIMQVAVSGPVMRRPRGAEERVADRRQDGGIETGLGRQADDRRIGDGRGQGHGRDGKAGQEIGAEPCAR